MAEQAPKPPSTYDNDVEHRRMISDAVRQLMENLGDNLPFFAALGLATYAVIVPSDERPDPTTVSPGSLVWGTDTELVYVSNGTTWSAGSAL